MKRNTLYNLFCLLLLLAACRQEYAPPVIQAPNRYLVVEGIINATPGERTRLVLSRTRNLADTFITSPELTANVQIEAKSGIMYGLTEQPNGIYLSAPLSLNSNETYRLKILTSDGKQYVSDFVQVKLTPPIDSLSWNQNNDVTVYAHTHDPTNNTRYYRWDFTETWQYRAFYEASLGVNNGLIFYRDSTNQVYNCWVHSNATGIVLGSSVKLSQDVIDHAPVTTIPQHSEKIGIRYSILVRQYALTEEAHKYWDILRKNTQNLGTLFDAQPAQLKGNIYNLANDNEPVIGYVSASSVQEKRLFIDNSQLTDWTSTLPGPDCKLLPISQDPVNYLKYTYADTAYAPYYFTSGGIMIALKYCLDCTQRGGTNQKPLFW